jgi:thymidine kinase
MTFYMSTPQHKAIQQVLTALERSHVQLLLMDDAHFLNLEFLEIFQMLTEDFGCPVLLFGDPESIDRMHKHFQVDASAVDLSTSQTDKEAV